MRPFLCILLCLCALSGAAIEISNRYRSPRNPERKVRRSTELIVLHTTEAPARSSLNKVSDRGECHFCVTENGTIYRIVDRDREAFHAGRSMWNGKEDVDKFSVGIECVGYHDKPMPAEQLEAIRYLVRELQSMYRIPDERVVCHSHVAYGAPNKWHPRRHRGRKRCGMLFAMPSIRARIGLKSRPAVDADVRARRLICADDYLNRVLYGGVDTMRGRTAPSASSASLFGWLRPSAPESPRPKAAVRKSAPTRRPSTGPIRTEADLKARGYVLKGTVSPKASASRIAGSRWNAADTYYVVRGKVIPGNTVDSSRLEKGMRVWMKK